jgi:hypothetical protein
MEELRQNNKCKDFIGVLYGFVQTGRKTEPFTRERLRLLHQKIYRLLAGLPRCHAKCSSLHKLKLNKYVNLGLICIDTKPFFIIYILAYYFLLNLLL